jgi:hypothetical protein
MKNRFKQGAKRAGSFLLASLAFACFTGTCASFLSDNVVDLLRISSGITPSSPDLPPVVSAPNNINYFEGQTVFLITWTIVGYGTSPSYIISRNGSTIDSGSWSSGSVNCNVNNLSVGIYIYIITATDTRGTSQDTVVVSVSPNVIPGITQPENFNFTMGEVGHTISWNVTDSSNGTTRYTIYRNGANITSGSWISGTSISINVDSLVAGTYNYTIVVADGLGGFVQDMVLVLVQATIQPSLTRDGVVTITVISYAGLSLLVIFAAFKGNLIPKKKGRA